MNTIGMKWLAVFVICWPGIGAQLFAESTDVENQQQAIAAGDVLALAEDVGRWLSDNAIREPQGISWPDDTLNPENVGYDLGSGVAGKVVYFAALYRATGNSDYLELALGAADYLLAVIDDPGSFEDNPRRASLYTGISGVGVALFEVSKLSADLKYSRALEQVVKQLSEWSVTDESGVHWNDEFNDLIYGDAGTTLFLATLAGQTGDEEILEVAQGGARFLLSEAQNTANGSYWLFRRSKPFNLPNFSHGTAGIAYVLATVGSLANDDTLLAGAQKGFEYIRSIAEIDNGLLRIPYGWGSDAWAGLYEFGWAHGLTGDANLFQRLQQADITPELAARLEQRTKHTILNIGLPGVATKPFAEPSTPLDLRFGRAGVLALLSSWSADTPEPYDITILRDEFWRHIESAAMRSDGRAYWEIDAPDFMGGGRAAYTGLFHGAAGIGLAVLRMHASMERQDPYILLPDDAASWMALSRPKWVNVKIVLR